jgi:asparagine synthase (glutamine-hydrolysing)
MCGISGLLLPGHGRDTLVPAVEAMTRTLAHRGPDGEGAWCAPGVALAHRRLAILDLSPAGAQPMRSASGRFTVTFNGEIYNFRELRAALAGRGHTFTGGSDTEVMLAAFEQWGVRGALPRLAGMFAFGLWDAARGELWLGRDRLGVKPLYYSVLPGGGGAQPGLGFASELKALRAAPGFDPALDRAVLPLFLRHGYIPAPGTIYRAARKLPPGCLARFAPGDPGPRIEAYWDLGEVWRRGAAEPFSGGPGEAAEALEPLLARATRQRMIADVPLGVLLSGGIDSSLVAALMREGASGEPVRAFTVGFAEAAYDETPHARAVARALGLEHTVLPVTARDLLDLVPRLPELWDEPFADASQVPTHLVFLRLASEVTVALTGDGADECFAGYARYRWGGYFARLERLPLALRRAAATACAAVPAPALRLLGNRGRKLHWRAGLLASRDFRAFYQGVLSCEPHPGALVRGGGDDGPGLLDAVADQPGADRLRRMQAWDMATYLPDDILVKADRASMGASVEARSPFLDHRVVEFAATLPPAATVAGGRGKQPLRRLLARRLDPGLFERPKAGFTLPVEAWLGGELRQWGEELLSPAALDRVGLLETAPVRRLWARCLAGDGSRHPLLWNVLMLQAWAARWAGG